MNQEASRLRVVAAFAAVYLIWGSTFLAIRFAIESIPPLLMAGTRFTLAGLLLYGWARRQGAARPARQHWAAAAVLGVLLLTLGNGGVVWAEQSVPSGLAALMVGMMPLWTVLVDWLRPRGERPTASTAIGLLVGFAGVALLITPGQLANGAGIDPASAVVLMGATLAWAIGSVYSRHATLPTSPLLATAMEMLAGGAVLLTLGLLRGEGAQLELAEVTTRSALGLGYLIVFGSLIAFTAFVWLLRVTTPARVSTYAYVNPVVALLLGWALAGEPLSPRIFVAAGLVIGAVALITLAPKSVRIRRRATSGAAPLAATVNRSPGGE